MEKVVSLELLKINGLISEEEYLELRRKRNQGMNDIMLKEIVLTRI